MRRRDLLRHLARHGCEMLREGSKHTVDVNRQARTVSTIPRHREIEKVLVKKICQDLESPSLNRPYRSRSR
jgi:mRNA interferase HicA